MAEKIFDKNVKIPTLHLGGDLPAEIVDAFRRQCEQRRQLKYGALVSAVKLWIELPTEIQARLLDQSINSSAFLELVNHIIDERFGKKKSAKGG